MKFPIPQSHYQLMQVDAIMAADFDFRIVSGGSENHLPRYFHGCCQNCRGKMLPIPKKIKEILEDHTLEDEECFKQIEGVVCVLEELGSNAGEASRFSMIRPFSRIIAKSNISYKIKI